MILEILFCFFDSISNILKGGLVEYWRRTEIKKQLVNTNPKDFDLDVFIDREYQSLCLGQFESTCYLFFIGVFCSLLILLIEFIGKMVSNS